ncbi:dienelactone hydrolase family protein [Rhodopseudomonas palustris]|uniref:dienelactone hydrolase family protein n=1 Tax=Rhodopseudomonas palustris TaxID=1076 RepID=UPI001F165176|nr:dienelactone hydrolase family protein [Rhodopseudomonas palustris]
MLLIILAGLVSAALVGGSMWAERRASKLVKPTDQARVGEVVLTDPRTETGIPVRIWRPDQLPPAPHPAVEWSGPDHGLPLVIYVPSWGGRRSENDVMLSTIAGAGFIVVAMDDISHDRPDPATNAADEMVRLAPFSMQTTQDYTSFPITSERRTRLGYDKLQRVLDALRAGQASELLEGVDFSRIAVVGYSFGGAVAARAIAVDGRFAAGVDLDGWVIHTPAAAGLQRPFLAVYAALQPSGSIWSHRPNYETRIGWEDFGCLLGLARSSGSKVFIIDGARHSDFSDQLYAEDRWRHWRPWAPKRLAPERIHAIIDTLLLRFLVGHLIQHGSTPRADFAEVRSVTEIEGLSPTRPRLGVGSAN